MVSYQGGPLTPLMGAVPAFAIALALSAGVRRFALAHAVLDIPNERSLHTKPTPRGGGLAIVAVVLGGIGLLAMFGRLPGRTAMALLGGALVALIGWLDDRQGLTVPVRLAAHLAAAVWALWWLGGMPTLMLGHESAALGGLGTALAGGAIVWAINIHNFMDGIDGLAAGEAATVTLSAAILLTATGPGLAAASAITGGAALGFLYGNWQPARIFMGDVGSGFLGFVLAVLAIASERVGAMPALLWLVLYAVFAVDATVTLLRRAWRGERWYSAHRSHAYQRAVQAGWSHARVTAAVLVLNGGLFVLGALVVAQPGRLLPALAAAVGGCGSVYLLVERLAAMLPPDASNGSDQAP